MSNQLPTRFVSLNNRYRTDLLFIKDSSNPVRKSLSFGSMKIFHYGWREYVGELNIKKI